MTDRKPAEEFADFLRGAGAIPEPEAAQPEEATVPTGPRPDPSQGGSGFTPPPPNPWSRLAEWVEDTYADGKGNWVDVREMQHRYPY
jgi:hypothetical protein